MIKGELMALEQVDAMVQCLDLNEKLNNRIPVLNFAFDVDVQIPDKNDNDIITTELFSLGNYVSKLKRGDTDVFPYMANREECLQYITELESSLNLRIARRFENDLLVWKDSASRLANIENGIRKTCDQPDFYAGTIYCFGMCTIYGALVEDCYTIPSIIQSYVNESGAKYRVVNLGNEITPDASGILEALDIQKEDIAVILFPFITDEMKAKIPIIEIGKDFNSIWKKEFNHKDVFMDAIQHCGDYGNTIYSKIIYHYLKEYLRNGRMAQLKKNSIYNVFKKNESDLNTFYHLDNYILKLQEGKKRIPQDAEKIGSIVMNCNPFTAGHRYLIEYALKNMEYLFIFVVEENRAFFNFDDRIEMVRRGTADLKNISVVGSGQLIISSETFPTYFRKDEVGHEENIHVNEDLRIFAQYIAPALNINYRFVGEEPMDHVTLQYNSAMKKILPEISGIRVIEIPRMCIENHVVSASLVRKYYAKKDFEKISELVPETTERYLRKLSENEPHSIFDKEDRSTCRNM